MSTNDLMWRPTPPNPPPTGHVPDPLSHLLMNWLKAEINWDTKPLRHDPVTISADQRMVGFLEGLAAAGVKGIDRFLAQLVQHGSIDLWWE